MIKIINYKYYY